MKYIYIYKEDQQTSKWYAFVKNPASRHFSRFTRLAAIGIPVEQGLILLMVSDLEDSNKTERNASASNRSRQVNLSRQGSWAVLFVIPWYKGLCA